MEGERLVSGAGGEDDHVLVSLGGSSGLLEDKSREEEKGMCLGGSMMTKVGAMPSKEEHHHGHEPPHQPKKKRIKIVSGADMTAGYQGEEEDEVVVEVEEEEEEEEEDGRGDPSTNLMQLATVLLHQHLQSPLSSTTPEQALSPPRSTTTATTTTTTVAVLRPKAPPHVAAAEHDEEDLDDTGIGSRGLEVVARLLRLGRPAPSPSSSSSSASSSSSSCSAPNLTTPWSLASLSPPPPNLEAACTSASVRSSSPGTLQHELLMEGAGFCFLDSPSAAGGVASTSKPTPHILLQSNPKEKREEEEEDSDDEMMEDEEDDEMDDLVVAKMPPSITDHHQLLPPHHHHGRNHKTKKSLYPPPPPPPVVAWNDCVFNAGDAGMLLPQCGDPFSMQQMDIKTMRQMVMALRYEDAKLPSPRMTSLVTAFKASSGLRLPMFQALTQACHDRMVDLRAVTLDMLNLEKDLQAAMNRDHGVGLAELLSSLVTCVRDEMRLHFPDLEDEEEVEELEEGSDEEVYSDGEEQEEEKAGSRKDAPRTHSHGLPWLGKPKDCPPQPPRKEVDQSTQTANSHYQQPCLSPSASSNSSSIVCTDSDDEATRAPGCDSAWVRKWADNMLLLKEALVCLGIFLRSHSRKMASNALDRAEMELISDAVAEIIAAYPPGALRIVELILRAWPYGQSTREVGFLQLLGIVLSNAPVLSHLDSKTRLHLRAFSRLANCLQSPHVAVAEEAVVVCSKPRVIALYISMGAPGGGMGWGANNSDQVYEMVQRAAAATSEGHWNLDIRTEAHCMLNLLNGWGGKGKTKSKPGGGDGSSSAKKKKKDKALSVQTTVAV